MVGVQVVGVRGDHHLTVPDEVVGEEPMEIRVSGPHQPPTPVTVTMRTPGHDFELAVGFLIAEGLARPEDIAAVRYCDLPAGQTQQYNVVTVNLTRPFDSTLVQRNFAATASCGICGTATLDGLQDRCPPLPPGPEVDSRTLLAIPEQLHRAQRLFQRTGGLHASGLFETDGRLVAVREDVGRHNALDKLVGWATLDRRLPLHQSVLALSGRVSYELVQKAAMAGIPIITAVSAPSSLAVATARRLGVTLVGFVRGDRANIYSGLARVRLDS